MTGEGVGTLPQGVGRHYAFFLFSDFGHVNPTLGLTKELVSRGHRVTYVIDRRYTDLVRGAGAARVVDYISQRGDFGYGGMPTADEMGADGYALMMETITTVFPKALEAMADDVPDVVLYDFETFAAARMAGHIWGSRTVQLYPNQASNEEFSSRVALFDADHPSIQLGRAALEKFLDDNDVPLATLGSFAAEWDDHNLVFMPREFQTRGETFDERFSFVGPSIPKDTATGLWSPPDNGRRVVLISLGTESNRQPDFFRTCAEAFDDEQYHVVMTVGRGSGVATQGAFPANVEIHEWLPHLAVLPHADAFVCQGGMGSIMESLYFATPVVVVPQTLELLLNGERISELGLGRMLHGHEFSAGTLRSLVDKAAQDPVTRERLEWMRGRVRPAGGARRAADELEGLVAGVPAYQ